ncbi:MAG: pilus assembly protein [Gammaproteobacteria bacterium]|nr:pilus assembly protein [Rhodocyclaceae bacterium]MBU3909983.1 pilus assembly protein [Gammaproteobacteria bacterium]MBU3989089.1 pilus assembly protein [Gammaproteobacteria bacterium]MBU4003956.1 pilus assembly protein [Gammaproteobacteria bacterium]MBU4020203.1 pilus assembly protein [Gammaproteobacteria bacterium]
MNKPGKSKLFKASLLAALLTTSLSAQAAGLGKLTVYSAIGQPLNAEVALTATPEELSALSARLASHDDFKRAGIEFMSALSGLRFSVAKQPDGQSVLKLTTDRPLNEPFLHFLVELNWTAGRLVREYTFLLDPPEMLQVAKPASVVTPVVPQALPMLTTPAAAVTPKAPAMAAAPAKAKAEPRPPRVVEAEPAVAPSPKPRIAQSAVPSTGERQVKLGDTLSKIARENKPATVSLDQMLVALFNSNRDVFDGNNMNRLRAGKILRLPDPVDVANVDAGEARKLIVAQTADFNAYRRSLADAAAMAPATETQPQQRAAGKIKPQVESKAPPAVTKDKLEVSPTEAAKSAKTSSSMSKGALEEDLIARDKALREASGRIAELEKNLENLKHLVELKSQPGAQVQQQAQATLAKPAEVKKPEPVPVAAVKPDEIAPSAASTTPAVEKAVDAAPTTPSLLEPAKPVEAVPAPAVPPAPAKPAVKQPASPPPPPEPSFIEENPELVFGGGGLIALLLGYLGFSAYRRKKQAQEMSAQRDEPGAFTGAQAARSGAVIGAASESVDSGEVSIQGDFSEGGVLTTAESVDPVAEADVYMAYGRDSQAEEILLEGLRTDPTRTAIHLKLLELYANRKSVPQFESVAKELHGLNGGKGSDWDRAAQMAAALGVTGGLFAAAAAGAAMVDQAAVAALDAAPAITSKVQAPTEEDAGSFDFDLDLGTSSGPPVAAEPLAKQSVAEEAAGLDFDFDLGSPTQNPPPDETAAAVSVDSNAIDFSLDAGSSAEPLAVDAMPVASNEIDFDLDLGSAQLAPAVTESDAPVAESGAGELDFNFDLELGAEEPIVTGADVAAPSATITEESPAALDLSEISFDLGEPTPADSASEQSMSAESLLSVIDIPAADEVVEAQVAAPVADAAMSAVAPDTPPDAVATETEDSEVATKLELALAYEEMGDREGARELLNEVLNEGSPAQQGQARARLDQLDL